MRSFQSLHALTKGLLQLRRLHARVWQLGIRVSLGCVLPPKLDGYDGSSCQLHSQGTAELDQVSCAQGGASSRQPLLDCLQAKQLAALTALMLECI